MKFSFKFFLFISLLVSSLFVQGQQDPTYSQSQYVPLNYNPGSAGHKEYASWNIRARSQWPSLNFANSVYASYENNFEKAGNIGLSVLSTFNNDNRSNQFRFAYAYGVQIASFKLALGIEPSIHQRSVKMGDIWNGTTEFDFSIGGYMYNENFALGYSINHLFEPNFEFSNTTVLDFRQQHTVLGKYIFHPSETLEVIPSIVVNWYDNTTNLGTPKITNTIANLTFKANQVFVFGLGYKRARRSDKDEHYNAFPLLFGYDVDVFQISYSFDIEFRNNLFNYGGAHELRITFDMK